jgi:hypothetical protein
VSGYRTCLDCPAPVKFRDRDRCHTCHRRAGRAVLKRPCTGCGQLRHLREDDRCAACLRAGGPRKTPKTTRCRVCGQDRRNVGLGLCNRCMLADPDRPLRYAASMATRMRPEPPWWGQLAEFTTARYHPGGSVAVLRETARILFDDPGVSVHQLRRRAGAPISASTDRVLTAFFTSHAMALPRQDTRPRATREGLLNAIHAPLGAAVAQYNDAQLTEQDRRARGGRRVLSDITLATRLRILRDLAAHLATSREVTGWAEVTTTDLERFLAARPAARHQRTYVLRRFFAWARARRLVLTDPTRPLTLGAQPAFTGAVLEVRTQRALFRRWTSGTTPAQERTVGLLALLHAATNAEIRAITLTALDPDQQTLTLPGRPFPTPIDPATWSALDACQRERAASGTLNSHLLVSRVTRSRDTPVHGCYLGRLLAPAGTTPSACRQTRIAQLVTDLDVKLTATALGMNDTGLVRYLADNVDRDRLTPTNPTARPDPGAPGATLHTLP